MVVKCKRLTKRKRDAHSLEVFLSRQETKLNRSSWEIWQRSHLLRIIALIKILSIFARCIDNYTLQVRLALALWGETMCYLEVPLWNSLLARNLLLTNTLRNQSSASKENHCSKTMSWPAVSTHHSTIEETHWLSTSQPMAQPIKPIPSKRCRIWSLTTQGCNHGRAAIILPFFIIRLSMLTSTKPASSTANASSKTSLRQEQCYQRRRCH